MKKAVFTISGTKPLLMLNDPEEQRESLQALSEQEIALKRAYRNKKGEIGIYASDLNTSIHLIICNYFDIPASKKVTEKIMRVAGEFLPLVNQEVQIAVDKRIGTLHHLSDQPIVVSTIRAKIEKWKISGTLYYNEKFFKLEQAKELLDRVGEKAGIGIFSPRKKGPFGRFKTEKLEIVIFEY